jgi:malate dehydrogenase (oxaloacetate-decarboxylating)
VAAQALAGCVDGDRLAEGALYPPQSDLRQVSRRIAIDVAREARARGLGRTDSDEEIERAVDAAIWEPVYDEVPVTPTSA